MAVQFNLKNKMSPVSICIFYQSYANDRNIVYRAHIEIGNILYAYLYMEAGTHNLPND